MIAVDDVGVKSQTTEFFRIVSKGSKAALMYDDFIRKTMITLYSNTPCPEQILLPHSPEEMLRGNFEPAEIIVPGQPEYDGIPMWRGDTNENGGVVLRGAGYVNGDSRYPCEVAVDDTLPHALLAGATGHGKSVTLNSLIVSMAMEYAPWEVQIILVDACDTKLIVSIEE